MAKQQPETFFDMDLTKYMAEMKVPGIDVDAFVTAQKKNVDAVTTANRLAFEGFQAIMKRQAEIVRQSLEDASSAAVRMGDINSPQESLTRQADLTREAYERTVANARELSEMFVKSNAEVFDLFNARFAESLEDIKATIEKAPMPSILATTPVRGKTSASGGGKATQAAAAANK